MSIGNKFLYEYLNTLDGLPKHNSKGQKIVIGCNYHTTWQNNKKMRFVLINVEGAKATLATRTTGKEFKTKLDDLIFITSDHNFNKAKRLRP